MPTLGALYPAAAPDVQKGAAIFAEKCAPCHGIAGLGDGPQSMQLPVTVPGIGLPEVARQAAPADWFKIVTQGNLDRFMPPFVGSLNDQDRWDVVAYAMTLHTTAGQLARGQSLVEADCPQCAAAFGDLKRMAALSDAGLVQLLRKGEGDVPAFAAGLSDDDAFAAAAYLRMLTISAEAQLAAAATPVVVASPGTDGTARPEGTPAPTDQAAAAGVGRVTGKIEGAAGNLEGITVTLHGFDHAADQTSGPQEVLTITGTSAADGSYHFENVEMPVNRIFLADVVYSGINFRSAFKAAAADSTSIALPAVTLHEPSADISLLTVDQVHIYTDFATPGTVQVLEIFAFSNGSDKAVIISTDGATIPFIKLPAGAVNEGIDAGQGSAPFVTAKDGLAVLPSDKPYSIIAFFSLPYEKSLEFSQPLGIDSPSILLLVPEGIKAAGDQLTFEGAQVFQNNNYQEYSAADLKSGDTLAFTISGRAKASAGSGLDVQQGWLIGGGALGLVLILAGTYLYLRDRRKHAMDDTEPEFESTEDVLDAILALDDLHRAGKLPDEAYHKRRNELKDSLRKLS
jgi:mono/diheme cytochrome c family protein